MAVTVPGGNSSVSPNVTLSLGTGDVLHLAQQIGALLFTVQGSGADNLQVTTVTGGTIPVGPNLSAPSASELIINNTAAFNGSIPGGYNYIVPIGPGPVTLSGNDVALVPGTVGGSFNVTGNSTVAPNGGNNTVTASGTYLLSFGPGNNLIIADGSGTIATDIGSSTVLAANTGGPGELIESFGTGDVINIALGTNTVLAAGLNGSILGGTGNLSVDVTGTGNSVSASDANLTATLGGSGNIIYPGNGTLAVTVTGTADTVVGSSAATTIDASGNPVVFGGQGFLTFIGGAGTASILGGAGGSELVTGGSGGVLFSANAGNNGTVIGGSGLTTIFGGAGSSVTFNSSLGGGILVASAGNETLNAAGSAVSTTLSGGEVSGTVDMVGGPASGNVFFAGNGSDTMTGGGSSDIFSFINGTTGGQNFITDFNSSDGLFLTNYDPTKSTFGTNSGGALTLTLSDSTTITFTNLTTSSQLNGHYLYVQTPPV